MHFEWVKDQKRLSALGVFMAVVMIFCVYVQFIVYDTKETAANPIASDPTRLKKVSKSEPSDPRAVMLKKMSADHVWGRNPFELPLGVQLRVGDEGGSAEAKKPHINKVNAILITDSRKLASIDHRVVAVGDLINGEKVLEIKPDRVILEKGNRKHVLTLEERPTQWTKNERDEHEK